MLTNSNPYNGRPPNDCPMASRSDGQRHGRCRHIIPSALAQRRDNATDVRQDDLATTIRGARRVVVWQRQDRERQAYDVRFGVVLRPEQRGFIERHVNGCRGFRVNRHAGSLVLEQTGRARCDRTQSLDEVSQAVDRAREECPLTKKRTVTGGDASASHLLLDASLREIDQALLRLNTAQGSQVPSLSVSAHRYRGP